MSGPLEAKRDRHADHFEHAARMQPECRESTLPSTARATSSALCATGRDDGFADERELLAAPSGDHQQIRAGLQAVVGGDRLQRRAIGEYRAPP